MEGLLDPKRETKKLMVLDLSGVLNIDTTGLEALETLHAVLAKRGSGLILSGAPEQSASLIRRSGFRETIGAENIVVNMAHARKRINEANAIPVPNPA